MIKYTPAGQRKLSLFRTPFENALDPTNRWVEMEKVVPWDKMAQVFYSSMSADMGRGSIDLRVVLGALLVKHIEHLSDEDTIQYIQENVYAQYFVGLSSFQQAPVFVPSLLVEIRKRLGKQGSQQLNDEVLGQARRLQAIQHRAKPGKKKRPDDQDEAPGPKQQQVEKKEEQQAEEPVVPNKGTLKMDATVAPQHIGYPTDTRLLHEARLNSEALLDLLFEQNKLWDKKPRTYRRVAQQQYLAFAKKRRPTKKAIKKARGQQLRYLRRNLKHLNGMLDEVERAGQQAAWKAKHWRRFWVLQELYRQQNLLHRDGRKQIANRIVNIAQPWVRPIKRGKAGKDTEFGPKLNVSETEGFVRMDQVDFNNFNESTYLEDQVEGYKALYGYYPEVALVDRIYLTRGNRNYLQPKGIRHCGVPLGRPKPMDKKQKRKRKKEQDKRAEIEGKFGQAKSRYGLDDIQMRRPDTSYACIGLILLAINVIKLAKVSVFTFLTNCQQHWKLLWHRLGKYLTPDPQAARQHKQQIQLLSLYVVKGS